MIITKKTSLRTVKEQTGKRRRNQTFEETGEGQHR